MRLYWIDINMVKIPERVAIQVKIGKRIFLDEEVNNFEIKKK